MSRAHGAQANLQTLANLLHKFEESAPGWLHVHCQQHPRRNIHDKTETNHCFPFWSLHCEHFWALTKPGNKQDHRKVEPLRLIHCGFFEIQLNRNLGFFCRRRVVETIKTQAERLILSGNIHLHPRIHEYAQKLTARLPDHLKVSTRKNSPPAYPTTSRPPALCIHEYAQKLTSCLPGHLKVSTPFPVG